MSPVETPSADSGALAAGLPSHLTGVSRQSLRAAIGRLDGQLADADARAVSDELFAVADMLDREPVLRRTLSDPSTDPTARSGLVTRLLGAQLQPASVAAVTGLVEARWADSHDLGDAVEALGRQSLLVAAERDGALDDTEDELFRFGRILEGEPSLISALTDRSVPSATRTGLLDRLVGDRVRPATRILLERAIVSPRTRSLVSTIEELSAAAALRHGRVVARVRTAVALDDAQQERLQASLRSIYRREVALQIEVDSALLGGLVVSVGDDVIDGSAATALEAARRGFGGRR
jgi:F-type H+-transporting ATPase subunit delta